MVFVRNRCPGLGQVVLELEIVDGDVLASVVVPRSAGPKLQLEKVPVRQAIAIVATVAARLDLPVAIIDPYGIWPD